MIDGDKEAASHVIVTLAKNAREKAIEAAMEMYKAAGRAASAGLTKEAFWVGRAATGICDVVNVGDVDGSTT